MMEGENEFWPSETDKLWLNESIMIDYLQYLYYNWSGNEPCTLVLECFKAHCTKKVLKFAKSHFIELIFVPANGTSDYQPLDRRIFGILKSKLRSLAGANTYSGKDRFENITNDLIQSRSEISPDILVSAWNIPNLEMLSRDPTAGSKNWYD